MDSDRNLHAASRIRKDRREIAEFVGSGELQRLLHTVVAKAALIECTGTIQTRLKRRDAHVIGAVDAARKAAVAFHDNARSSASVEHASFFQNFFSESVERFRIYDVIIVWIFKMRKRIEHERPYALGFILFCGRRK